MSLFATRYKRYAQAERAYGYLSRLFKTVAPQCEPMPDLLGLCTQIDNYIAGLRVENGHSEHDQYVIARARNAADKPYDQDTCRRYPWAAAARITYLEGVVAAVTAGKSGAE